MLEGSDVEATVEQLKDAKAVILDLRNYPNWEGWRGLLSHFVDHRIKALPMYKRRYVYLYQYASPATEINQWLSPVQPFLDIPVIVLSSSYSIS